MGFVLAMSLSSIDLARSQKARRFSMIRMLRRFARRKDGATAVEFAAVIGPFIAIMFAIIEVALTFFAGQVLETAVADSSRLIMTGQAQKLGLTQQTFKNDLCGRLYALFDCANGIHIDVKKYNSFGGTNLSPPGYDEDAGEVDTSGFGYEPGVQGDIVIVRVVYEWPTFVRAFGLDMATLPNGKRLLMATAAFRNEPYSN
jgi:Flp pilus assembly protein TadG